MGGAGGYPSQPTNYEGGAGGVGVELPAVFRSPELPVPIAYPGPNGSRFWVCGGGGGKGSPKNPPNPVGPGGGGAGGFGPTGNGNAPIYGPSCGGGNGFSSGDPASPENYPGAGESGKGNSGGGGGGSRFATGGNGADGCVMLAYPW